MIKLKASYSVNGFDAIRSELDNFEKVSIKVGKKMTDATRQTLLDALQREPGNVARPIQWTSIKQRKAYFATNGFGAGIPYKRRGRLAKAWVVTTRVEAGKFSVTVANDAPSAQFVYGTLNMRSLNEAMRPKQAFHTTTGWPAAQPIVKKWTGEARKEAERAYAQEFEQIGVRIKRRSRRS